MQHLEKYSITAGIQVLASSEQSLWLEEGEEVGDGRAEGSSATGDARQDATSLTPDVDGTGSGSLLDSILSALLKEQSSDVWVVTISPYRCTVALIAFLTAAANFVHPSTAGSFASKTNSASSDKQDPLDISCAVNLFNSSVTSSSCLSSAFPWASHSFRSSLVSSLCCTGK